MTTQAQTIIKDVQVALKDKAGIRWPAVELIEALNAAQRDIAVLRPDLMARIAPFAPVAGALQTVPPECSKLTDIPRNTTGPAIRQVRRDDLDSIAPDWYSMPGATVIKHFCYDPKEPRIFWVYPPAAVGASVQLKYAALPVDVPAPAGNSYTTVTGNLSVDDVFANAAMHFVLWRAYLKDAESGGNAELAVMHKSQFDKAMGDDLTTRQAVRPRIKPTTEE